MEKVQLTREAKRYLSKGEKVPASVPLFEGVVYGPYLKYRWQEHSRGPAYTIQMGMIPVSERAAYLNDHAPRL